MGEGGGDPPGGVPADGGCGDGLVLQAPASSAARPASRNGEYDSALRIVAPIVGLQQQDLAIMK
jgi:hypothetical protein